MFLTVLLVGVVCVLLAVVLFLHFMSGRGAELRALGVDGPKPLAALRSLMSTGMFEGQKVIYEKYKNKKIYGNFMGREPVLVVSDLDLVRDVLSKHFNHFADRRPTPISAEVVDNMLTSLKGDHWKHARAVLSPAFSTGRLKRMCTVMEDTQRIFVQHLVEKMERNEAVELKEVMSSFTMDAIARFAFGAEIDTMKNPQNPFMKFGVRIMSPRAILYVIYFFFPFVAKIMDRFGVSAFDIEALNFFSTFVDQAMAERQSEGEAGEKKDDFLQIVLEAEREFLQSEDVTSGDSSEGPAVPLAQRRGLTKMEIKSSAILFMMAGFDTTAANLSFTLFLLAAHPECLERVLKEVDEKLAGAVPTYDNVQELTYLEMCLSETLRLHNLLPILERQCVQTIELGGVTIPAGIMVQIPLYSIHHDPDIWPEPDQYKPERFSKENKETRHNYAYLPFGMGPRACIGLRLAMVQMKMAMASILQRLTPVQCEKTKYPMRLNPRLMKAEDGLWVKFERRQQP